VIDYRKHRWMPLALVVVWLGWLFAMSRIGLAGLERIGEDLWLGLFWVVALGLATFGLPYLLFRRLRRQNRTR
jgi:hypothetical protein